MKLWPRSKTLRELRGRVEDQMIALWNRNQLIADQDQVITELRGEKRKMEGEMLFLRCTVTELRTKLEATAAERDYWQGKAANP